jgi:hypothetical protein
MSNHGLPLKLFLGACSILVLSMAAAGECRADEEGSLPSKWKASKVKLTVKDGAALNMEYFGGVYWNYVERWEFESRKDLKTLVEGIKSHWKSQKRAVKLMHKAGPGRSGVWGRCRKDECVAWVVRVAGQSGGERGSRRYYFIEIGYSTIPDAGSE